MAELIRTLVPNAGYGERATRGARLLLRWFAAGREMAVEAGFNDPEEPLRERLYWYQRAFESRYEFWPSRGDESLRSELDDLTLNMFWRGAE